MQMRVKRYDSLSRLDGVETTPQGYLKAKVFATRTGVFKYRRADGSILRELRHPDDVFNPDSYKTLANVALTNDHPSMPLDASNTRLYQCGFTGDSIQPEGDLLKASVTITDLLAIQDVAAGKEQVSCGYHCDIEEIPGDWQGEQYDCRQRNIVYNHLSIVDLGRAGPRVRLQMDADDAELILENENSSFNKQDKSVICKTTVSNKGQQMAKLKIDEVEHEFSDGVAQTVKAKLDALEVSKKELETLKGQKAVLDSENEKLKKENEALKNQKLSDEEILKRADALSQVRDFAKTVLGAETKLDGMSIEDMKKAVIKTALPTVNVDSASQDFLNGSFEMLMAQRSAKTDENTAAALGQKRTEQRKNDADENEKIRLERIQAETQRYK